MRSPHHFNLREAITAEIDAARTILDAGPRDPVNVHKCRVSLKRARALARIGAVATPGLSRVFQDTARDAMAQLAAARELAALSGAARTLAKKTSKKANAALTLVAEALDAERATLGVMDLAQARARMNDLAALAKVWPQASDRQIRKGAARVRARAWRAYRRGRGAEVSDLRHDWRKREKDALYASSLLGKSWPYSRKRKTVERLGDVLGAERDALILADRIAENPSLVGDFKSAKRALKALAKRSRKLAKRADRLGEKVHADAP
jgi:CHAD domain-containing protein